MLPGQSSHTTQTGCWQINMEWWIAGETRTNREKTLLQHHCINHKYLISSWRRNCSYTTQSKKHTKAFRLGCWRLSKIRWNWTRLPLRSSVLLQEVLHWVRPTYLSQLWVLQPQLKGHVFFHFFGCLWCETFRQNVATCCHPRLVDEKLLS